MQIVTSARFAPGRKLVNISLPGGDELTSNSVAVVNKLVHDMPFALSTVGAILAWRLLTVSWRQTHYNFSRYISPSAPRLVSQISASSTVRYMGWKQKLLKAAHRETRVLSNCCPGSQSRLGHVGKLPPNTLHATPCFHLSDRRPR